MAHKAEDGAGLEQLRPGPEELEAMHETVVRRADAEGLVEVAYCELDSPFGPMLAAATEAGLVLLSFPGPDRGAILERIAGSVSPRVLHMPYRFDSIRRQLEEYFEGARKRFDVELDWQLTSGFTRAVLERTNEIPFGSTRTYSEMAELAGSPRAHRAAGSALGANPIPIIVPCHRVLRVGGGLGGYGGGLEVKRSLLELEGALKEA